MGSDSEHFIGICIACWSRGNHGPAILKLGGRVRGLKPQVRLEVRKRYPCKPKLEDSMALALAMEGVEVTTMGRWALLNHRQKD